MNSTVQVCESPKPHTTDVVAAVCLRLLQNCDSETDVLGAAYDLKSAYRQVGLLPGARKFAYIAVYNPDLKQPEVYRLVAAPLSLVWTNFFDDFITFCRSPEAVSAGQCVESLFCLLGWGYAESGEKAGLPGSGNSS